MVNPDHIPQVTVVADAQVSVPATIGTLTVAVAASATDASEAPDMEDPLRRVLSA